MRRFFTEPENVDKENQTLVIYEDASHISKVLRMECGDRILVFDGSGFEYEAELTDITKNYSCCKIIRDEESKLEPHTKITLFQGIPKSGKLDVIVQKAVELGVYRVVPVRMSRCVAKIPNDKKGIQKIERLNKIAKEAAKQCGRGLVPQVTAPVDFSEVIRLSADFDLCLMLYEELGHDGKRNLKQILKENEQAENIAVIIGPEGGFSNEEADELTGLKAENTFAAGLGPRILRTETAGSTVLSIIMYEKNEI